MSKIQCALSLLLEQKPTPLKLIKGYSQQGAGCKLLKSLYWFNKK